MHNYKGQVRRER